MGVQLQGGMARSFERPSFEVDGHMFRASASLSPDDDSAVIVRVSQVDGDPSFAWHQVGTANIWGLTREQAADATENTAMAIAKELGETIRRIETEKKAEPPASARKEPVAPLIIIDEATEFTDKQWEFLTDMPRPAGERAVQWTADAKPTCSGPLDTHGTPVLRVGRRMFKDCEVATFRMCDACWLFNERYAREETRKMDEPFFSAPTEPTARVGTVPQSLGPMRGIWASRGMRGR